MIKVKQIAHICIFADDLKKTREFYQTVLGLEPGFNFLRDGNIFGFYLDAGGRNHIEIFQKSEASFSETNQINHLCLEVENIDKAVEHIANMNVDITPKRLACDDTYQAWLADPNGVKIELFEYTDKSAQFAGGDREADW